MNKTDVHWPRGSLAALGNPRAEIFPSGQCTSTTFILHSSLKFLLKYLPYFLRHVLTCTFEFYYLFSLPPSLPPLLHVSFTSLLELTAPPIK